MLAKINRWASAWVFLLALVLVAGGCTPSGTRAMRNGHRLLERGETEKAIREFKLATSLHPTNAAAWNYLGLAYHRAADHTNAIAAYQQALELKRDLIEARFNLGCLWSDLKRFEHARETFASCTVLRPGFTEAWIERGKAELRLREAGNAEASFRAALKQSPQHPEALNGLGLALWQRQRPREAAQQFAAAIAAQSDYAPALLNLATVSLQYFNDRPTALRLYRSYLALTPRPSDWDAVNRLVLALDPPGAPVVGRPPAERPPSAGPAGIAATSAITNQSRPAEGMPTSTLAAGRTSAPPVTAKPPVAASASPAPAATPTPTPAATVKPTVSPTPKPTPSPSPAPEVVTLPPEPAIRTTPASPTIASPELAVSSATSTSSPAARTVSSLESNPAERRNLLSRINPANLFRDEPRPAPRPTPLPPPAEVASTGASAGVTTSTNALSDKVASAAGGSGGWPRYVYQSPAKPADGDRAAAERALLQGQRNQAANRLVEALRDYQQAVKADPGYFRAQFAVGLAAYQATRYREALTAWEQALAIEPGSTEARYNFALALKGSGYPVDAARELQRVVSATLGDARAHLALANLYAENLRDRDRARTHYLKVLELSPSHPQSTAIRYWLLANGG